MREIFKRSSLLLFMVIAITAFILFVNPPGDAFGQAANTGRPGIYHNDIDFEMLTVTTSPAVGFGNIDTTHPETSRVWFRVEDDDIRIRADGTDPTSTVGTPVYIGEIFEVIGYLNITKFRAIGISGTAKLSCHYGVEKQMK